MAPSREVEGPLQPFQFICWFDIDVYYVLLRIIIIIIYYY